MSPQRFEVYWVELDPTVGHEIQKTRPCVVISPNNINHLLGTVIVAPLTSQKHEFPYRIPLHFKNTRGEIALDQMRCVDKSRLRKRMGHLDPDKAETMILVLAEMFAW
ncbi:MAG: type II toxin-antitoxin system PemK/MazF family toxin [Pseudomonadota bacterium]|nr:type II toxin-antitoxin system PemK/MazF family toxin [Pseudomonadota bacterium]